MRHVLTVVTLLPLLFSLSASGDEFTDSFAGTSLSPVWSVTRQDDPGLTASVANGQLLMTKSVGIPLGFIALEPQFTLSGDFSSTVDVTRMAPHFGMSEGLGFTPAVGGGSDVYLTGDNLAWANISTPQFTSNTASETAATATLKIDRMGSTLTLSYKTGLGGYTTLLSRTDPSLAQAGHLSLFLGEEHGDASRASVAFQNFSVQADSLYFNNIGIGTINAPPTPAPRPVYPALPPRTPGAKGLILVVHGWNSSPSAWADSEVANIKADLGTSASQWDVEAYDWQNWAGNLLSGPGLAASNAFQIGNQVGDQLRTMGYSSIHFIGHSAGSWLIDRATTELKSTNTTIQETFLDAYVPPSVLDVPVGGHVINGKTDLGLNATFAEQYVDSRFLPPFTNSTLDNAFNVDVTKMDPNQTNDVLNAGLHPHQWPYQWYMSTTASPSDPIAHGYGFQLSPEVNPAGMPALYAAHPKGTRVTLGGSDGSSDAPPTLQGPLDLSALPRLISSTGTINIVGASDVQLKTGSPAWIACLVPLDKATNILSFDYNFSADAQGWLSVYFDNELVFNADERVWGDGLQSQTLWLGQDFGPGNYTLSFRLDPESAAASVIDISDVQFGFVPEPVSMAFVSLSAWVCFSRRRPPLRDRAKARRQIV